MQLISTEKIPMQNTITTSKELIRTSSIYVSRKNSVEEIAAIDISLRGNSARWRRPCCGGTNATDVVATDCVRGHYSWDDDFNSIDSAVRPLHHRRGPNDERKGKQETG
uniref:Uncharacterized protein n=1 Tax=Romanomermis culicivorax TaxID=13658 RepID=A0A915K439_ROMCU